MKKGKRKDFILLLYEVYVSSVDVLGWERVRKLGGDGRVRRERNEKRETKKVLTWFVYEHTGLFTTLSAHTNKPAPSL